MIEVSRRNSEGIAALQLSQLRSEAALQLFQPYTDEAIERLDASIGHIDAVIEHLTTNDERTERLLNYLIHCD